MILAIVAGADHSGAERARELRVADWLDTTRGSLESNVNNRLNLIWGLEAFVIGNPDFTEHEFHEFAAALERRWNGIRSVQLAPGGMVRYLSKRRENDPALGIGLFASMYWRPAVSRAMQERRYVVAGPLPLAENSRGIVGRMPIFVSDGEGADRLWGFAQVIIDIDELLQEVELHRNFDDFSFALRGEDGDGFDGAVFHGAAGVFEAKDVIVKRIVLPGGGSWVLGARAAPTWFGPWEGRYTLWGLGLVLALIGGGLTVLVLRWPQRLQSAVINATVELEHSQQHYRQLCQVAPTGIYQADHLGNIVFANDRFREILGIDKKDVSEADWNARIHPDDLEAANEEWDQAVGTGKSYCVYRYLHDDGRIVWVIDRAMASSHDAVGRVTGFIGTLTEITQQKEIEAALEVARVDAERANNAKSEFLASMSHEIRTPLNGIIGMLHAVLSGDIDGSLRERLEVVRRSGDVLLDILNDLLDISKIEAGKLDVEMRSFDMTSIVREVVELWQSRAIEKGLTLRVKLPDAESPLASGDANRARQVLSNLVSNAVKFSDAGEICITVETQAAGVDRTALRISVADQGVGISKQDRDVIFEKFGQGHEHGNRQIQGTGLGLAISRELVQLMGGEIGAEVRAGRGALFWFTLAADLSAVAAAVDDTPTAPADEYGNAEMPFGKLNILIAEDNAMNRMVISAILEQPGLDLDLVEDGPTVVKRAADRHYDLILMDIRMPGMDGVEATRAIRSSSGPCADVPIIALTANAMPEERSAYLAAGIDDCVTKPIVPKDLFAAIASGAARALRAKAAGSSKSTQAARAS